MRKLFILLVVPLLIPTTLAQQFINWKNYTALKNVRDITIYNEGFWSAANGGAFSYSSGSREFSTLHKVGAQFVEQITQRFHQPSSSILFRVCRR